MDSETNEVVKEPFAAVQTLYYGENKYGYSDDVKGRKGKLGPGDTYSDLELETLTLWWGQEKSESGMSLRFEGQFGIIPKNQSCQILNYPFTTMPVTIHSWQLNKDTMSGWLDTLEGAGLNMVYTDSQGQQVKREDPGFRVINMLGAGDAADKDNMLRLMRETALKSTSNGEGRIDVANALATTRLTQNSSADMAPVVAVGGGKALVAWRAVAASDSGAPTEFDSYDTIQYKVYDFNTKNWSGPYTLYNGTSGAVKGAGKLRPDGEGGPVQRPRVHHAYRKPIRQLLPCEHRYPGQWGGVHHRLHNGPGRHRPGRLCGANHHGPGSLCQI